MDQSNRMRNKQLRRNRENGLLPKCLKYGQLDGVELFLGIKYTDKDEFYTYASKDDLSWLGNIPELVSAT